MKKFKVFCNDQRGNSMDWFANKVNKFISEHKIIDIKHKMQVASSWGSRVELVSYIIEYEEKDDYITEPSIF